MSFGFARCRPHALRGQRVGELFGRSGQAVTGRAGQRRDPETLLGVHELDRSIAPRQDLAGWQQTMNKMVAFGMKATEQETSAVLEYLVKNFPAEEVPKINLNKAKAIELESGLSLKRSQAAGIIQYRDKHGDFKSIEDLKKVPGVDFDKIEAKKDRLTFEK